MRRILGVWSVGLWIVMSAVPVAAEPRIEAPPAATPPALPAGTVLAPLVELPTTPPFRPRAAGWWKKKVQCPPGAHLVHEKDAEFVSMLCRDRDGKQHGPGVALFAGTDQPYEDSWALHGKPHGTRWTWRHDGVIDHIETFVDGRLQGHAKEFSGGHVIAEGDYLDGKRHGLWTYHYPNGIVERGNYDHGHEVGTWIGAREGAATATLTGDASTHTWRVFDAAGRLTLERVVGARDEHGSRDVHQTGWSPTGVRIAEYDCPASGQYVATFFDDRGALARRWSYASNALVDAHGAKIAITADQQSRLATAPCGEALWMSEGPPPARDVALGTER